jgi:D-alanyl-D-alanine carboxypeptidase
MALQSIVEQAIQDGAVGVQVTVRKGDKHWSVVAGYSNLKDGIQLTQSTPMRTASITKIFTYAIIHKLIASNKLALTDTLSELLDKETLSGLPATDEITIEQLLEHTSGLYNASEDNSGLYTAMWSQDNSKQWSPLDVLEFARKRGLLYKPGEDYNYSNTNYILLGLIAEKLTGQPLATLYQNWIFTPFEMNNTFMEGEPTSRKIAHSYDIPARRRNSLGWKVGLFNEQQSILREDGLVAVSENREASFNAWPYAAGAIASTSDDLDSLFQLGFYKNDVTLMKGQQSFIDQSSEMEQYGWTGGSWGISSVIWTHSKLDITIIALVNNSSDVFDSMIMLRKLAALLREIS